MSRTVVVTLVTGERTGGRLIARLHDVESGREQVVRDGEELVVALRALAVESDRYDAALHAIHEDQHEHKQAEEQSS